jgi:hydroxyacylglutathione hydrolase
LFSKDELVDLGFCKMKIIHTPGHSPGGICLVDEKNQTVFSGDTIFKNSIGRVDLPGGDYDALLYSIKTKLLIYPDDFVLYPGHMDSTTIAEEKMYNPFLSGDIE